MNQESEYQKSYNRGKSMIERYLRAFGKEQGLNRIKDALVKLTSDEEIANSKYNKGQIDALIDYVYGLKEDKIRLTESLLRNVIRESINRILNETDKYKGQTNGWRPDPNYTRKNGKVTPKPSSEYSKTNIEPKPFNTDEWQEQYRDNRGYKFSSKGSGPNKQWKREKVSESQLHNIVKESINKVIQEVAGYQSTMQKANNQFNQNTMMGKLRSKIMPNKYQQYQRIQQQGNQMGQDAADRINNEREKMGYIDGLDRYMLNYGDYAESQGLGKHMETGKNWGDDREYMNKYFSHERDLMNKGREAYNKNTAIDNGRVNKYGTNSRILKSEAGWNSEDNYNNDEYHKQRNELGLPTHN